MNHTYSYKKQRTKEYSNSILKTTIRYKNTNKKMLPKKKEKNHKQPPNKTKL